jgi:hypothetical protein
MVHNEERDGRAQQQELKKTFRNKRLLYGGPKLMSSLDVLSGCAGVHPVKHQMLVCHGGMSLHKDIVPQ